MATRNFHRCLGAVASPHETTFRVWAPEHAELAVEVLEADSNRAADAQLHAMLRDSDGYFSLVLPGNLSGQLYRLVLPNGSRRPDPASRFQPRGVHGPSQVIDAGAYAWRDQAWQGISKDDLLIYELHLGTFTAQGTYRAAAERLSELQQLGITAVELMPLAESAGGWNWGYDGVLFYAPRHTYGTPDDFRYFVDQAHQLGLAVILDVVYNHFGPEGNYFREFGPYVSAKHRTAWGDAPNFDGPDALPVRDYFTANISYWMDEFHLDGLRVDAIHCMADESPQHIVSDLAASFDEWRSAAGRHVHLIAESNVYDARMLQHRTGGGHGYDAEWCDDFLHSVFAVLRPGEHMSQRVYSGEDLQMVLHRGYVFAGSLKVLRQRISLEEDPHRADLSALVYSIQNHDFIGNHPLGQRLHRLVSDDAHRAAAALLLLVPAIPMLFMGEEFAADEPFYFFVDYGDAHMREAVERGRRAEYPQHDWTAGPAPTSADAFTRSKLGPASSGNAHTRQWYQTLISLRKQWRAEGLLTGEAMSAHWYGEPQMAVIHYAVGDQWRFVVARLSNRVMQHAPVALDLEGTVMVQQNCDVHGDGRSVVLRENGVVIGSGRVALSHPSPAEIAAASLPQERKS